MLMGARWKCEAGVLEGTNSSQHTPLLLATFSK